MQLVIMRSLARNDTLNRMWFVLVLGYGCGMCVVSRQSQSVLLLILFECALLTFRNNSIRCLL
jgi:hypothetical protein